jgi:hypothetical protein
VAPEDPLHKSGSLGGLCGQPPRSTRLDNVADGPAASAQHTLGNIDPVLFSASFVLFVVDYSPHEPVEKYNSIIKGMTQIADKTNFFRRAKM